ncbi:VWDE [Branchiostoma lanceolatum]|uniref:VWDE protein n=1 Tax=Branchiostoma lanceolatum TaxID=7740 RepID=A0A8J9VGU4_BRALA|nr:VWDE [Branchiostoma lanceolatum]
MYRDPSNKKFSINLPSGASVQVDINYWGLDVHAYLPASDWHHTEGLCGTWDGNQGNDFTKRDGTTTNDYNEFGNSWKIDRGASLFDVDCPTEDHSAPAAVLSCSCGAGNNIECGYSQNTRRNVLVGTNTATTIPKSSRNRNCGNNAKRKKRSPVAKVLYSDDIEESDGYVFDYGDNQPPPPAVQWPTATLQITEEKAVSVCREAITNSSVAAPCSALGVDIFKPVDACVEDIQFTEDFSITVAHVETMKADCTAVAFQNVSLHDKGDDGDPVPPAAIVQNLCPADCSQQGQCVNGTCDCFDGFTAADCSQVEGSPPQVWFIPNNGLCDIRLRPCQKTSVIADGLIESSNLTCRVRHVEIRDGNTTVILDSDELTNATLKSFREVTCQLPRSPLLLGTPDETERTVVYGFYISVSNDGVYFSDELLFTIYDSVCQNCTVGPKCFWKENTCKIRGFCFADGDPNPNNWCQQCLAQLSNHTFTERPVNLPPAFTTPTPITRVIKENLSLAIAADDPEGRPIKFSFPSDQTPTISLQDDGELKWTADERAENFTAILMVTDECGASTTQNFAFAITTCPCQNNGTCIPDPGMPRGQGHYMCDCLGYTGRWCEEEIDECQSNPCNNGTCEDLVNMFSCMCDDLHVGEFCHIDIGDHCGLQPCFPGVLCTNMIDGFECGDCPGGYVGNGTDCKDVDECASNVTNNCVHACRNIPGSFECTCPAGFLLIADQCFDIDECTLGLAGCSHLCTNTNGSYNCHCPDGFILEADNKECSDIDECVVTNHGCQDGCENTPGSYTCRCPAGYKLRDDGKTCEEINECASNPCENGATCHDNVSNYTCECQPGWDGQYCEHATATSQAAFPASSETTATTARTTDLTYLAGKPERARRILPAVLTMNNTFLPQYNDKTSVEYIALSQKVIKSLTTLYERIQGFVRIILIHFKPGSIMVTYVTMFEASEAVSDSVIQVTAQRNLQQAVRSGTFDESLLVQHLRHVTLTDEDLQQMYQDPDVCSLSCGEGGMCELTEKYPGVIVAECVCEANYCISGSCTIDFEEGPKCSCPSDDGSWYGGERCQMTLSNSAVIGIALGFCCAALIVITLLIVCMMKRRNAFQVKERDATRFGPGGLVLDNVTYGISPPRAMSVVRPSVDRRTSSKSQWRPSVKNIPATQIKIPRPHVICNSFPRQGNRTIKTSKV